MGFATELLNVLMPSVVISSQRCARRKRKNPLAREKAGFLVKNVGGTSREKILYAVISYTPIQRPTVKSLSAECVRKCLFLAKLWPNTERTNTRSGVISVSSPPVTGVRAPLSGWTCRTTSQT